MKDIRFEGVSYNPIWIARHSVTQFVKKCETLKMNITEEKAKELYHLVCPKKTTKAEEKEA